MMKININGRDIITNCGGNYSIDSGDGRKTMRLELPKNSHETDAQMLERLAQKGYKKIMAKNALNLHTAPAANIKTQTAQFITPCAARG